ncbi:hypothetical protein KJ934_02310 [Patescibacteria group bacterium]|nr:hypothetical protein [Patescibacteria group bacterium]MBU4353476.1 hypothetical protein [Patescibacteria group bacterium]MBU4476868.1 hypothetical protein [Patescibacteria group bacterium]MCG2699141.1 hypothetical protein [Candidatus Parcubacteria bacterium]
MKYKFVIHKVNRQSNFLKLELPEKCISGEFNNLGGKIIARFFTPKGVKMSDEIRAAFIAEAAKLLETKRKKTLGHPVSK